MTPNSAEDTRLPKQWMGLFVQFPYSERVDLTFSEDAQVGTNFTGQYVFQEHGKGDFNAYISPDGAVTMELERGSEGGNWRFVGTYYPTNLIAGAIVKRGGRAVAAMDVFSSEARLTDGAGWPQG